ncbi:MAG: FliH/SctL family protein [Cyanobacteria bacterium P01_H01_bin.74]
MKRQPSKYLANQEGKDNKNAVFNGGNQVEIGHPIALDPDADLTQSVQTSLEILAKNHLQETEAQGNSILDEATTEARAIIAEAKAEAEAIMQNMAQLKEAAYEEGFKAGFTDGYNDATQTVAQETLEKVQSANMLLETAYQAQKKVLSQFKDEAVYILGRVAKKIFGRSFQDDPALMAAMVDAAVKSLYLTGKIQVVLNPAVIQQLRQAAEQSAETLKEENSESSEKSGAADETKDPLDRFEFIADEKLSETQIFIVGSRSCINLTPDQQIDTMLSVVGPEIELPDPELLNPELPETDSGLAP